MEVEQRKARFDVGEKGKDSLFDFNAPAPEESHEIRAARTEYWIAKRIGEDLVKTYPNRQWTVNVDTRNETIVVSCPSLSKRMGYLLHIKRDTIAGLLPRTRKAAGEILERFNVTRGRILDPANLEAFPRDSRDDAIASDASEKDATMKFNYSKEPTHVKT
jgi:hypothetical protein